MQEKSATRVFSLGKSSPMRAMVIAIRMATSSVILLQAETFISVAREAFCRDVFQNGKTLPIDRGAGIDQPIMHIAAQKASQGEWVHVFPESKISYTGQLLPLKRGIGKLICDSVRDSHKCASSYSRKVVLAESTLI